jgi:hypothetical protein
MLSAPSLRPSLLTAALLLAMGFLAVSAPAQTRVYGTVTDALTGQPVPTVDLRIADEQGQATGAAVTGSQGEFRIELSEGGTYTLTVRHVAYVPVVSHPLELTAGDQMELSIRLDPGVVVLDAVTVVASRTFEPIRIAEYRERAEANRRMGRGRILMREDLDRIRPNSAQDVIDTYSFTSRCTPTVLVDGLPADGRLNWVTGDMIEGVEIYRGITQIPPEYYRYGMCGLVLVWQRFDGPGFRPWTWGRFFVAAAIVAGMVVLMR